MVGWAGRGGLRGGQRNPVPPVRSLRAAAGRSRGVIARAAVVILIGTLLTSCTKSSSTWKVGADGGTRRLGSNLEITLPPGAVPAGAAVKLKKEGPSPATEAAGRWRSGQDGASTGPSLVTDVFSIDSGPATLALPAVLRFRTNYRSIDPGLAFAATFDEQSQRWVPVGGDYDPTTQMLTVTTEHLSSWAGFTWAPESVRQILQDTVRKLLGPRVVPLPPISCSVGGQSRPPEGVSLEVGGVQDLDTCMTGGDNSTVDLKIRNPRSYPLVLVAAVGSATLAETPGLSQTLRGLLGQVTNKPGTIYLPSGATANVHLELPPGSSAQVVTDADMYAYLLEAISLAVEVYAATYTTLLGAATADQEIIAEAIGSAVDLPRCAETALGLAALGNLNREAMSKWGKAAFDCTGAAANSLTASTLKGVAKDVALILSVVAFVVRAVRTVVASGEILGDMLTNTVNYLPTSTVLTLRAGAGPGGPAPGNPNRDVPAPGTSPAARPIPDLFVSTGYERGTLYRYPNFPKLIGLSNHDSISQLEWKEIGPERAVGTGVLNERECVPNCAEGSTRKYPVQIVATNPKQCRVEVFPDYEEDSKTVNAYVFNKFSVRASAGSPGSDLVGDSAIGAAC